MKEHLCPVEKALINYEGECNWCGEREGSMTQDELIKRLQTTCFGLDPIDPLRLLVDDVIEALRENAMREVQRLGQEIEQEPVAYLCENAVGHKYFRWKKPSSTYKPIALYTSPPAQRTWVGLMRGVRVEGDTVVITVKGGNDEARCLCGELISEMDKNT